MFPFFKLRRVTEVMSRIKGPGCAITSYQHLKTKRKENKDDERQIYISIYQQDSFIMNTFFRVYSHFCTNKLETIDDK